MDKQNLILQLYKARKLCSKEEYELFEDAMIKLQGNIEINDVYELCKVFCDDTEDEEVMFEMVHLIEQLISEEYLECIAKCSPKMTDAHKWAMTLNKRILNSQKNFDKYIDIISKMEDTNKTEILELLIDVKNDNPKRFGEKVDYILGKVN